MSAVENLVDMGFEKERAELAVAKAESLDAALQWLSENEDKSTSELQALAAPAPASTSADNDEPPALKDGEVAKSMVCNECNKKLRSMAQAEFHAEKSGHINFAESTEEIAPLTEEQKKEKLAELKMKAAERKLKAEVANKEEAKKNEKIRMKATKEIQDAKEEMAKQEQIKVAAKKRQEKLEDAAAKKRIQEKIAADKEARRQKAEAQKAEREGRAPPADPSLAAAAAAPAQASAAKREVTDARLRLQTSAGVLTRSFPVGSTLFEVAQALEPEIGGPVSSFTLTYPKKIFSGSLDFSKTLKEAGLAPSAVLIVQ